MTWQMVMTGAEAQVVRVAEGQVAVAQEAKEAEALVIKEAKVAEDQADVAQVVVDLEVRAEEDQEVKVAEAQVARVDVVLEEEVQAVKVAEALVALEVKVDLVVRVDLEAQASGLTVPTTLTVMVAFGLEYLVKVLLLADKIWTSSAATEVLAAEHRLAKAENGASSARMNVTS